MGTILFRKYSFRNFLKNVFAIAITTFCKCNIMNVTVCFGSMCKIPGRVQKQNYIICARCFSYFFFLAATRKYQNEQTSDEIFILTAKIQIKQFFFSSHKHHLTLLTFMATWEKDLLVQKFRVN